ncbi:MAG: FecR family protein [Pseudomonadales bacterium]
MTDQDEHTEQPDSDLDVRRLMELAGRRLEPPAEVEQRVRDAVLRTWEEQPGKRRVKLPRIWYAMAATITLAMTLGYFAGNTSRSELPAGEVIASHGGYSVRGSDGVERSRIMPGSMVQTSAGGSLFIALQHDPTLRVDQETSLTFRQASEIWLHRGRIYLDNDNDAPVRVMTRNATVTDIGTQFEISADGHRLSVVVREGQVDIELDGEVLTSTAAAGIGETVKIEGLRLISREPVATMDSRWGWVQAAHPPFKLKQKSVAEYARWAARESGRTLIFDSEAVRQQAGLHRFSGEGEVNSGIDSVARTLRTTRFAVREGAPHELIIEFRAIEST